MHFFPLFALAGSAAAQLRGFNYGALLNSGAPRTQQDFESEFNRASSLPGTSGFTSARLYTMIQGGTANTFTTAIPAAIATKTNLLLGLWGSGGQTGLDNEITALKAAIGQYGTQFTDLIVGISVGSEDLYRISPTGIENKSGVGAGPDEIISYIGQVRAAIAGTFASGKSVGHVDTWTAWTNSSNSAVISAVDWIGFDGYPYYQTVDDNSIDNAQSLFFESYNATVAVSQGKPVWVTETGWAVQGPQSGQAVASVANAARYWKDVACRILGNVNTFWFTLDDDAADASSISFSIVGPNLGESLFDLSCGTNNNGAAPATSFTSSSVPASPATAQSSSSSQTNTPQELSTLVTVTCPSSVPATSPTAPATPAESNCPANLNGQYEFPHLLVPVDSKNPSTAYGTQYNGRITTDISSIFDFDIPAAYAGKTCSLVFLFLEQKDLQTSSFTFNGQGGFSVAKLAQAATEQTTYANMPARSGPDSVVSGVAPGNSYAVMSASCEAGARVAYEFSSTGGLDLEYFQDYNPKPIGAYITVC